MSAPLEVFTIAVSAVPSFFMLLEIFLSYETVFGVTTEVARLLKQKDLFGFGTVQLAVGAVGCELTGHSSTAWILVFLTIGFLALPYFTITLIQHNHLGWVSRRPPCLVYVGMVFVFTAGASYIEHAWKQSPVITSIALLLAAVVFLGEFGRST
jgi:hypothetical protein